MTTLGEEAKTEEKNPLEVPPPKIDGAEKELTPNEKMVESLKPYPFLQYANGVLVVNHDECKETLELKILKMGDLARRGTILNNLSGGSEHIEEQTAVLNGCLATVQVGFTNIKLNLLEVTDSILILGLYTAVVNYNSFFRKTPLGIVL